jgi:rsbT co-antagonist protein RsbR
MSTGQNKKLAQVIRDNHETLLKDWLETLANRLGKRDKNGETEIRRQAAQFLTLLVNVLDSPQGVSIDTAEWGEVRHLLSDLSRSRVQQGFSSIDTANFIFALKEPLFSYLRQSFGDDLNGLAEETSSTSVLFDQLGLYTIDVHQKAREQVILRQQQELLELSTPVVQLWQNVLALPLIGTLDSARTQVVMENLLQKIVDTGAVIAIIDITGVPTVDTLVAQHLMKTIAAARLMGADCIISGIRPQIAQTIVHLGVNLEDVITKATLADAFLVALKRTGSTITLGAKE